MLKMRKQIPPILLSFVLIATSMVMAETEISKHSEDSFTQLTETTHLGYTNITVEQAYNLLTSTTNGIQIPIDVRTNSEWAIAHIDTPAPEHPQHWPYLQNGDGLTEFLDLYQGKEIIVYCKAGSRSTAAANLLVANHFNGTIYMMLGGIDGWTQAGYPTKPNTPPETPSITGEINGDINHDYDYTVTTTDIDTDYVYYYVNWSDNTTNQLFGPFDSGEPATINHTWSEKGTYTVKVKARDRYGSESDYATLEIKMPYRFTPFQQFLQMVFERFTNLFPVLQQLFGF